MKKGLITLGLGFLLVFIGAEGGVPFLAMVGGVGMAAGCVMVGWNFDLGSKSSGKSSPTPRPKPAPEPESSKPDPQPAPEPVKPAGKCCRHCGAKAEPGDIYCIQCGNKL